MKATPHVHKVLRRLLYVAEKVIDYNHMDMRHWFIHDGPGHVHLKRDGKTPDPHGCGTSACLLGWALTDKTFRDLTGGFLTRSMFEEWTPDFKYAGRVQSIGLTNDEFWTLFDSSKSGRKQDVIRRIKAVMADNKVPGVRKPRGFLR